MKITVPCEVIARLATALPLPSEQVEAPFRTLRYDSGVLVVSDRHLLAAEYIGGPSGVVHITTEPAFIAQCKTEGAFGSVVDFNVVPEIRMASAKTSLGWVFPGNACVWFDGTNDFDKWRTIIPARDSIKATKGAMTWNTLLVERLVRCSPSGLIRFPEFIDIKQPCMLRDVIEDTWFGMFIPDRTETPHWSACAPDWLA